MVCRLALGGSYHDITMFPPTYRAISMMAGAAGSESYAKPRIFTAMAASAGVYDSLNCGYGSNDDPACIDENRRRVAAGLGFAPDNYLA